MSFDSGIDITNSCAVEQSAGSYVSLVAGTFSDGHPIELVGINLSSGLYVSSGSGVFSNGYSIDFIEIAFGSNCVFLPGSAVYANGCSVAHSVLPVFPGDNGIEIILGVTVDFIATPRSGAAPLTVQFRQQCAGTIEEFYWRFGDGKRSYHSDPVHIYTALGFHDVYLRIKLEDNRYFDITKKKYILVLPGGLFVSRTNRLIRQALLPEQGIGYYEMPVVNMPMPEAGVGVLTVYDANNQIRGLVLDAETGKWYDVTTRDGPSGTGLTKVWTGKAGEHFDRILKFREDRGTDERDFERLLESHVFLRPLKETNRNQSGYDANGYPDGMEIDLDFFKDGEPTTPTVTITDVPLNGDLKCDKKVEGNRLQMQVTVNRGAHYIMNRLCKYASSRRAAGPELRIMSEMSWQEELAQAVLWMSYYNGTLINRVTGAALGLTGVSAVSGPEGISGTAQQFSTEQTLPSVSLSNGSVLIWVNGTVALSIGGTAISLTDIGTVGSFTLKYAETITKSGAVKLTPTGTVTVADLRMFAAALSSGVRTYYKNDVEDNSGGIVLP